MEWSSISVQPIAQYCPASPSSITTAFCNSLYFPVGLYYCKISMWIVSFQEENSAFVKLLADLVSNLH